MLHEHATKHAMEHGTPKLTGWPTGSQGVAAEQGVCALSSWIVVHEDAIHSGWFEWFFGVAGAVSLFIVFSFSLSIIIRSSAARFEWPEISRLEKDEKARNI